MTSPVRPIEKIERGIKSDASHDRDANGQQSFDQDQEKHGPMSDEQLQKAVLHLQQLPAVKEHKWTVELLIENSKKFILIKDNLGTPIRKIPELELWTLPLTDETSKGHLLKKTA